MIIITYIYYHLLFKIPEGDVLHCLHGGDDCPWESFEAFFEWFEKSTGLEVGYQTNTNKSYIFSFQIPDVDIDIKALIDACMSGSEVILMKTTKPP